MTSDWRRKHMFDLAWACKECEKNDSIPEAARIRFGSIYMRAKQLTSLPGGGNSAHFGEVIMLFCSICKEGALKHCQGRFHWGDPCDLIHECIETVEKAQSSRPKKMDSAKDKLS